MTGNVDVENVKNHFLANISGCYFRKYWYWDIFLLYTAVEHVQKIKHL